MSQTLSKVNIVTVTYNSIKDIDECVEYLYQNTGTMETSGNFHYTIVDNGSKDGTAERLGHLRNSYSMDVVLLNRNTGVSWAHNYVWRNYPGEHYVKLDPDVRILTKGSIDTMAKIADENESIVGTIGLNVESRPVPSTEVELSGIKVIYKTIGNLGGACILIPNYVNKILGYWDVLDRPYGEEDAIYGLKSLGIKRKNIYLCDYKASLTQEDLTSEYRKFKDECRKHNVSKDGMYQKRLYEYMKGIRPIYNNG